MHYTAAAAAAAALLVLLAATAAGGGGSGGGGGLRDVARCSRRVARGSRGIRSDSGSNPVFRLEVTLTPCFVACPLCFKFDMHNFCEQDDDIDSVCPMFGANPAC